MVKKKQEEKGNAKKRAKKGDFPKPAADLSAASLPPETFGTVTISPETIALSGISPEMLSTVTISPETIALSGISPEMLSTVTLSPETIALSGISPEMLSTVTLSPETIALSGISPETISIGEDLKDNISELRKKIRKLNQEITEKSKALKGKEIKIDELQKTAKQYQKNVEEMRKQLRLQHLMYRVHPLAWKRLKDDEEFMKLFAQKTPCPIVIMAIDIRKSTELMLRAKDPERFQNFIISLCEKLRWIILENCGVFDKFTGDGILAFFPEFYSGNDALYLAVKAAEECHTYFSKHYENNRSCFTTVLKDVGLGIGIDYGDTHLVNLQDWLTVIGTPVVYACRLSGAPAGLTLVNQQAYDVMSKKFGGYINFQDYEHHIKEGSIIVYISKLAKKNPKLNLPSWRESANSPKP